MEQNDEVQDRVIARMSLIETHLQTILTGILIAGVIWIASSVNSLQQSVAVLDVEVRNIKEKIIDQSIGRFDRTDAVAQLEIRDLKITALDARISNLETDGKAKQP